MTNEFGSLLKNYRRTANLSQRKLAELANLDFSYISKIENDRLPPPAADTIVLLCKILNVPPEELLALTGKIPSKIQENISSSKGAQMFLREAQQMDLKDDEWERIIHSLKRLRGKEE